MIASFLPRILVIDDLLGRQLPAGRNKERADMCGQFLLQDVTGDEDDKAGEMEVLAPIAQAVFFRGQRPPCALSGDIVENDLEGTLDFIRRGWDSPNVGQPLWSMVLLDLCFYTGSVTSNSFTEGMGEGRPADSDPDSYFGLQLLEAIHRQFADLPVAILSGKPSEPVSARYSALGVKAFLPRDDEESPQNLESVLKTYGLLPDASGKIIGQSLPLLLSLRDARVAAASRSNVLIRGESGTGKELFAKFIHHAGGRRTLVTVSAPGIEKHLLASELFGHKKGAFTGAGEKRQGKIKDANGGDFFVDEIGSMAVDVQASLLRVVEDGVVVPMGSNEPESVDVRFIFATNEDLEELVRAEKFRGDFLMRMRGKLIRLPSLRDRMEDLPLLIEHFVRKAEVSTPGAKERRIHPDAIKRMQQYPWPGNIRELGIVIQNAVEHFKLMTWLQPAHLQLEGAGVPPAAKPAAVTPSVKASPVSATPHPVSESGSRTLEGALGRAAAELVQLLKAALVKTATTRVGQADGEISITRAVALLTGNAKIKTPPAADLIKRIFRLYPAATDAILEGDPVLQNAFSTAQQLRSESLTGTVLRLDGLNLHILPADSQTGDAGQPVEVTLDSRTQIEIDRASATVSDLKPGMYVRVTPSAGVAEKVVATTTAPRKRTRTKISD